MFEGKPIRAKDIPTYCNEDFYTLLNYWYISKEWGLPNGDQVGWVNEPSTIIEAFIAFQIEDSILQREEQEKRERDMKSKSAKKSARR